MKTIEYHNPENLTPEQYEAHKGYRLLTAEEAKCVPAGAEYLGADWGWYPSKFIGSTANCMAYRIKDAALASVNIADTAADPLSRYEQARRNWRCVRRDVMKMHFGKLVFHSCGLFRAIFGL